MILDLRKRHRAIFIGTAAALPLAFAAGLLFRSPPAPNAQHPALSQNPIAAFEHCIFEREDLWPKLEITTRVFADTLPPSQLVVELHPTTALPLPEVLAYWQDDSVAQAPPALHDAFLLGALAGTQPRLWFLPESALHKDGQIILFSLPHQTIIAQAHLPLSRILQKEGKP